MSSAVQPHSGFVRIAAAVPRCAVADVKANCAEIIKLWQKTHDEGASVVTFPELSLCGYTARDLFHDAVLLDGCRDGLVQLAQHGQNLAPLAIVGLPLQIGDGLFNVAALIQGGSILGIVPKSFLPNYREFEETRWFRAGRELDDGLNIDLGGMQVPVGTDLVFPSRAHAGLTVGVELCEDFWVPRPPSMEQVSAGATVICNLSASNFVVGKAELRRLLARSLSDRGKCAYVYVAAGPGESSTDLTFDADAFICENGSVIAQSDRFLRDSQLVITDVDLDALNRERMATTSFGDSVAALEKQFRKVGFLSTQATGPLKKTINPHPFLPKDPATLATRCWEVFEIQSNALATRMEAIGTPKLILGVSGGLDSTQAALVAIQALHLCGRSPRDLICITMPGLGTTAGTRSNAEELSHALGAQFRTIDVAAESRRVLQLMDHPAAVGTSSLTELIERLRQDPELADISVENVQARLRTLLLMCIANDEGGLVVGTGDLSEKALGWSTFAGDQISMYDVNAGVPKTLIQFVIRWVANERAQHWSSTEHERLRTTLFDILDTPISPELLPADAAGQITQLTEEKIGPYELHDFFLFHLVRRGRKPSQILDLAQMAFHSRYDDETLRKWMGTFVKRFFWSQFKRSCTPDGPKVGTVALSPRGDWRMPSDARVDLWLENIDAWKPGT